MLDPSSATSSTPATRPASTAWAHYCELHAVRKPDAGELHIARAEGDGDEQVYLAAWGPARMVGGDVEG